MQASTMQLERREAIELVLSIQGLVAIATSNEAFSFSGAGTGSEVKTTEVEKSYKRNLGL